MTKRITYVLDADGVVRHIVDDPRDFPRHANEALEAIQALDA